MQINHIYDHIATMHDNFHAQLTPLNTSRSVPKKYVIHIFARSSCIHTSMPIYPAYEYEWIASRRACQKRVIRPPSAISSRCLQPKPLPNSAHVHAHMHT